eukprot:g657.t1
MTLYCLNGDNGDFKREYGSPSLNASGWKIKGGGRVRSAAAFNLLGGYIEFDMDVHDAKTGVNNNFYLTSPDKNKFPKYCDIQGHPGCMEMDICENNGHCVMQTTYHTHGSIGKGNCDRGGCYAHKSIKSKHFHMRAAFGTDGKMTVTMDGDTIDGYHPSPNSDAKDYVKETMAKSGAMIHSSQWTGWVPGGNCGSSGSLNDATFFVENVRVLGTVVQGDEPTKC